MMRMLAIMGSGLLAATALATPGAADAQRYHGYHGGYGYHGGHQGYRGYGYRHYPRRFGYGYGYRHYPHRYGYRYGYHRPHYGYRRY